jgi:hypothetical protein
MNQDDSLVWAYLGHRLGVDPARAPRPATNVVGIRALAYFDPRKTKGSKPIHIGDFPCAVFETVDCNRNRHALRIYLTPGGTGKAELGVNPDGKARNPNKLAKAAEDESTAGRAVGRARRII